MIRELTVKNFRGFEHLEIPSLSNFNLIIGKNNVGKTALLEAVFLNVGQLNTATPIKIQSFRGINAQKLSNEFLWGFMFNKVNLSETIEITSIDNINHIRALKINFERSNISKGQANPKINEVVASESVHSTDISNDVLKFTFRKDNDPSEYSYGKIQDGEIIYDNLKTSDLYGIFCTSNRQGRSTENAERFSSIDIKGQQTDLINILQKLEPRLKRLLTVPIGPASYIFGELDFGRAIPIQLMGEGISQLITIALAIMTAKGGIVMIDEIENGIHYSVMPIIYDSIIELAKRQGVQIFATTHSYETMKSLFRVFEKKDLENFSIIRLDRNDNKIDTKVYHDKNDLKIIFDENWEIR